MILSFSTKHKDGKPTYFVEQIWNGLGIIDYQVGPKIIRDLITFDKSIDQCKLHTIRDDKHNRWHAGVLIHFTVFPRSKRMLRFAPIMPCVCTQKIEIEYIESNNHKPIVVINGTHFYNPLLGIDHGMENLAKNDGFNSIEHFFKWFNKNYVGKIIHWTDLIYKP